MGSDCFILGLCISFTPVLIVLPAKSSRCNLQILLSGQKLFESEEHGLVEYRYTIHRIVRSSRFPHPRYKVDRSNHCYLVLSLHIVRL